MDREAAAAGAAWLLGSARPVAGGPCTPARVASHDERSARAGLGWVWLVIGFAFFSDNARGVDENIH